MRLRGNLLAVAALVPLAGCFQSQAPPPAASPDIAARVPDSPVERVQMLADHPDKTTMSTLTTIVREDADPAVRQEAIYAMADIGGDSNAATIAEALRDPDEGVRIAAIDVLSTMDGETSAALLVGALQDENARVRLKAVNAFGDSGGPTATLALQQALGDPDARVRETAAELLEERSAGRQ